MSDNPLDFQAREREEAEKAAVQRAVAELRRESLKWLMGGPKGRRAMWLILSFCGVFQRGNGMSQQEANRAAGRREVGIDLLDCLSSVGLEEVLVMFRENGFAPSLETQQ